MIYYRHLIILLTPQTRAMLWKTPDLPIRAVMLRTKALLNRDLALKIDHLVNLTWAWTRYDPISSQTKPTNLLSALFLVFSAWNSQWWCLDLANLSNLESRVKTPQMLPISTTQAWTTFCRCLLHSFSNKVKIASFNNQASLQSKVLTKNRSSKSTRLSLNPLWQKWNHHFPSTLSS